MKSLKSILCAAALALTMVFSACTKESENKYSADLELSFTTTDEMAQITTRQVEVLLNGQTLTVMNITGASFYKTLTLPNLTVPANILVNVTASFSGSEVPESVKARNTYVIKCTCGNGFATSENTDSQTTVTRDKFSDFLELMNHSVSFTVNENGTLSKK